MVSNTLIERLLEKLLPNKRNGNLDNPPRVYVEIHHVGFGLGRMNGTNRLLTLPEYGGAFRANGTGHL